VTADLQITSLLTRLADGGVDFVVIGGVAVIAHSYERNTKDVDICYAPDPTNLEALGRVLAMKRAANRAAEPHRHRRPDRDQAVALTEATPTRRGATAALRARPR
jgi:hypothetical protein